MDASFFESACGLSCFGHTPQLLAMLPIFWMQETRNLPF